MSKFLSRWLGVLVAVALTALIPLRVNAAPSAYYVSPSGSDLNPGTPAAPFKSLQKAAALAQPGDSIVLLAGIYNGAQTVSLKGTQSAPITIIGERAVFDGGSLTFKGSQWLVVRGLTFKNAVDEITVLASHYLVFRENIFDFTHTGILVKEYSSHLVIEGNEFYQSCSIGKTWSQLKASSCEGGAVYGSSYGGGTYYIRNNHVHDVFNGFLFTDDSEGKWMNANVFISGNRFERVVDDPAEPEGDSFNFHVYNNTMLETHRIVSLTTDGLGPVFVYNNLQITTGNPTSEASRLNSAFKVDLSDGYVNGLWIFNNTVMGETAANFSAYDMLSRTVASPWVVRNNIYVTAGNAFNKTPAGGSFDYDISKAALGVSEPNGLIADPMLSPDGYLASSNSPAVGRSAEVSLPFWFVSSVVIPAGANLGAFQNVPAPAWVKPPEYPNQIPSHVDGWQDALVIPSIPVPTDISTEVTIPTLVSVTPTPSALVPTVSETVFPTEPVVTQTPLVTETPLPPTEPVATQTPLATETPFISPEPQTPSVTETPLSPTEPASGTELIYDDTDSTFVYSKEWKDVFKKKAWQGSFKLTNTNGASVSFTFTGQSFSVLYKTGSAFRKMDVYVDDILVGTINQKANSASFQQRWDFPGQLVPGSHTLKLVFVTPNKSNKTNGSVDAVIVRQ